MAMRAAHCKPQSMSTTSLRPPVSTYAYPRVALLRLQRVLSLVTLGKLRHREEGLLGANNAFLLRVKVCPSDFPPDITAGIMSGSKLSSEWYGLWKGRRQHQETYTTVNWVLIHSFWNSSCEGADSDANTISSPLHFIGGNVGMSKLSRYDELKE